MDCVACGGIIRARAGHEEYDEATQTTRAWHQKCWAPIEKAQRLAARPAVVYYVAVERYRSETELPQLFEVPVEGEHGDDYLVPQRFQHIFSFRRRIPKAVFRSTPREAWEKYLERARKTPHELREQLAQAERRLAAAEAALKEVETDG